MLNAILLVRHNLIVKQIFAIAKTWKWWKKLENFIVGMYKSKCWRNSSLESTNAWPTRVQILYNTTKCHGCIFCCEILCLYAAYNLAFVDSSVFWIFVVIVLLNTKSSLIATQQLVYSLSQKALITCSIECFSELCAFTIFWPIHISWLVYCQMPHWRMMISRLDTVQVKSLYCAGN